MDLRLVFNCFSIEVEILVVVSRGKHVALSESTRRAQLHKGYHLCLACAHVCGHPFEDDDTDITN